MRENMKTLLTASAYSALRLVTSLVNKSAQKLEKVLEKTVPTPLDMKDDTLVLVEFRGRQMKGLFRGVAPDGSYSVRLTNGLGLYAFAEVKLA